MENMFAKKAVSLVAATSIGFGLIAVGGAADASAGCVVGQVDCTPRTTTSAVEAQATENCTTTATAATTQVASIQAQSQVKYQTEMLQQEQVKEVKAEAQIKEVLHGAEAHAEAEVREQVEQAIVRPAAEVAQLEPQLMKDNTVTEQREVVAVEADRAVGVDQVDAQYKISEARAERVVANEKVAVAEQTQDRELKAEVQVLAKTETQQVREQVVIQAEAQQLQQQVESVKHQTLQVQSEVQEVKAEVQQVQTQAVQDVKMACVKAETVKAETVKVETVRAETVTAEVVKVATPDRIEVVAAPVVPQVAYPAITTAAEEGTAWEGISPQADQVAALIEQPEALAYTGTEQDLVLAASGLIAVGGVMTIAGRRRRNS